MIAHQPKVIALTGAASGIGRETAIFLAARGHLVALSDLQQEPLDAVVETITKSGGQAIATAVDVRQRGQVEAWYAAVVKHYGRLDGCGNIAGVIGKRLGIDSLEDVDDDDFDLVQSVNVKGVLNCLRAQIPYLKSGGSIVNIASVAGLMGFPQNAAYCASKHAVVGLTRVAAKELGPKAIRCNAVCPGAIETPMLHNSKELKPVVPKDYGNIVALGRTAHPSEVAALIDWLLSDGSSYITGSAQQIDGGWIC